MFGSKIKAAMLHAVVTALVALVSGWLVFYIWYPEPFAQMLGGGELYRLVLVVELSLGPLVSLVIYDKLKPRAELIRDYTLVGIIQASALMYGLYVMAESRPVFMVFVKDRIEILTSLELDVADLGGGEIRPSWFGVQLVCVEHPVDKHDKSDLLWSALEKGKDIQHYSKYYRPCLEGEILGRAYDHNRMESIVEMLSPEGALQLPEGAYKWLPAKHRFGVWVKIYPESGNSYYLPIDPFVAGA